MNSSESDGGVSVRAQAFVPELTVAIVARVASNTNEAPTFTGRASVEASNGSLRDPMSEPLTPTGIGKKNATSEMLRPASR